MRNRFNPIEAINSYNRERDGIIDSIEQLNAIVVDDQVAVQADAPINNLPEVNQLERAQIRQTDSSDKWAVSFVSIAFTVCYLFITCIKEYNDLNSNIVSSVNDPSPFAIMRAEILANRGLKS